jgi:heme/copper-type cytochrome/quinol oxidase subunit 2
MFRFEFKRALGHVWYVHPLLWGYCTLYYTFETYYQVAHAWADNYKPFLIVLAVQVLVCLVLFVLVIKYPNDSPHRQHSIFYEPDLTCDLLP